MFATVCFLIFELLCSNVRRGSQCIVLNVRALIMLPIKCEATSLLTYSPVLTLLVRHVGFIRVKLVSAISNRINTQNALFFI